MPGTRTRWNVIAAIDWALSTGDNASAARLVASCGGLFVEGVASAQGVRWTSQLLKHELDDDVRARLLLSGAFAAVAAGAHDLVEGWSHEAATLSRGREPAVESIAATWQATPLMLRAPDRVPALLARAREAATAADSALCRGFAEAWSILAAFCVSPRSVPRVTPQDAARYGGLHSGGWGVAIYGGVVSEALHGRLDAALEIAAAGSERAMGNSALGIHALLATALAGEPTIARAMAVDFVRVIDRFSDVVCHAELVLVLGIIHARSGDPTSAIECFEAAKRAPMFGPHYYRLLVDQAALARAAVADEHAVEAAVQHGRRLGVEGILDDQLRTAV